MWVRCFHLFPSFYSLSSLSLPSFFALSPSFFLTLSSISATSYSTPSLLPSCSLPLKLPQSLGSSLVLSQACRTKKTRVCSPCPPPKKKPTQETAKIDLLFLEEQFVLVLVITTNNGLHESCSWQGTWTSLILNFLQIAFIFKENKQHQKHGQVCWRWNVSKRDGKEPFKFSGNRWDQGRGFRKGWVRLVTLETDFKSFVKQQDAECWPIFSHCSFTRI